MNAPDLRAVDDLCRLVVVARRLGCGVHLTGADADLRSLLDLAGVGDLLCGCEADASVPDGTGADLR